MVLCRVRDIILRALSYIEIFKIFSLLFKNCFIYSRSYYNTHSMESNIDYKHWKIKMACTTTTQRHLMLFICLCPSNPFPMYLQFCRTLIILIMFFNQVLGWASAVGERGCTTVHCVIDWWECVTHANGMKEKRNLELSLKTIHGIWLGATW